MSQLQQHLRAWSLDAVEACLLDAGIELIQDAMELTRDDLDDIGLSTAQAIALRHSFGFVDEHAATVAQAVASVAASGMEVLSSASVPAGQNLGGSGGAKPREATSQLEVHMRDHGLDDALTLLHEVGLELLGEVRALDCDDLRAMGLSAKDASTLRSSLGLDATPPGKARPGDEVASLEAMLAEAETAATAMQKLVRGRSSRRNHAASPASPAVPTSPAQPDAAAAAPAAAPTAVSAAAPASPAVPTSPAGKARPGVEVASLEAMLAEAETAATAMQKLVRGRSSRRNHAASPASPAVPTPPAQPDAAAAAPAAAANLRSDLPTDLLMPDAVADEEKRPGNKGRARAASMIEEINAMIEEDRMNKSRPPRRARHHSPHRGSRGGS